MASLTAALAGMVHLASCTDFSATGDGPDAASGADAGGATDGGTSDAPQNGRPEIDAAGCSTSLVLDFEDPAFPPPMFEILAKNGMVTRTADRGVGKSGALLSELTVPGSGGAYAHIVRTFDLAPGPSELHASFDFTAPTTSGVYATAGCELILRATAADKPTTDIYFSVTNGAGPVLNVSDDPSLQHDKASAVLEMGGPGSHHGDIRVDLASSGTSSTAYGTVGSTTAKLDFTLAADPITVTLRCGFYADSASGAASIVIDNVGFSICPKP